MALVVEDGTGLANAESYVSVADADAYHVDFGNTAWASSTEPAKEAALRRATQYLDSRYRYRGEPLTDTQALAWPRTINDAISDWPVKRLADACCELAVRALAGGLYTDQTATAVTSKTVGPISVSYAETERNGGQIRFALIDDLLAAFVFGGGRASVRLEVA